LFLLLLGCFVIVRFGHDTTVIVWISLTRMFLLLFGCVVIVRSGHGAAIYDLDFLGMHVPVGLSCIFLLIAYSFSPDRQSCCPSCASALPTLQTHPKIHQTEEKEEFRNC
jgi:hypothetical protein